MGKTYVLLFPFKRTSGTLSFTCTITNYLTPLFSPGAPYFPSYPFLIYALVAYDYECGLSVGPYYLLYTGPSLSRLVIFLR